jgi:hypothetical protein
MTPHRESLGFSEAVGLSFAFLYDFGFSRSELDSTIVCYRKNELELCVYHGRQSYEIGVEVRLAGSAYSIESLIRTGDPIAADQYRAPRATTAEQVSSGVAQMAHLVRQHAQRILQDDPTVFGELEEVSKNVAQTRAQEVLARQLHPKAEAAFRLGRYQEAVDLYQRIEASLSPTDVKKLQFARKRASADR